MRARLRTASALRRSEDVVFAVATGGGPGCSLQHGWWDRPGGCCWQGLVLGLKGGPIPCDFGPLLLFVGKSPVFKESPAGLTIWDQV